MSDRREYQYCGPEREIPRVKNESPLSAENAITVIRQAWAIGRFHVGSHFKKRCTERNIDMLDVENAIHNGTIRGKPEHCPIYKNWKYRVRGLSDERTLEIVIALDPTEDYSDSPLAILLTAYEKTP